jgi:prepilin-type processing-associated H-X9-DG protein
MRNPTEMRVRGRRLRPRDGFTLTELAVLIAVGAILASVLVADLSQARMKLLQQACAANLKQWGMAIDLYSQDFNGTYYMGGSVSPLNWDDTNATGLTNVYLPYVGGGDVIQRIRTMRTCPFVAAKFTQAQLNMVALHTYSMPIPSVRTGGGPYRSLTADNQNYYWPSLKSIPFPATYLLLIDSSGHTLSCGALISAVNGIPSGDSTPAIARHGGSVNCLFGDFHAELVSSNEVTQQAAHSCALGQPWLEMN